MHRRQASSGSWTDSLGLARHGRRWKLHAGLGAGGLAAAGIVALLLRAGTATPQYRLGAVTEGPVTAAITSSGTVNPVINVQVGSQVSGQIQALYADFNTEVKTGQLIARIDPALLETQVKQAWSAP